MEFSEVGGGFSQTCWDHMAFAHQQRPYEFLLRTAGEMPCSCFVVLHTKYGVYLVTFLIFFSLLPFLGSLLFLWSKVVQTGHLENSL